VLLLNRFSALHGEGTCASHLRLANRQMLSPLGGLDTALRPVLIGTAGTREAPVETRRIR
jgi:hypothetical protein